MANEGDDWRLLVGPGARLASLHPILSGAVRNATRIEDLDELLDRRGGSGTLLVDADVLPAEDLGFLRRFLSREPDWHVTLVGEDSSRRVARTLLRMPRVRWMSWPPDLEDLREIVSPAFVPLGANAEAGARPRASGAAGRPADSELSAIESILEEPASPRVATAVEAEPAFRAQPGPRPPRYFKDQVADLADLAQKLESGLSSLREAPGRADAAPVDALSKDVARLVQFTRTLSYVATPPPPGAQSFDLAELLELLVAGMVRKTPDAPRWLHRTEGPLEVRSDRELLTQAFDALLVLADRSAGAGQLVRVAAKAGPAPGTARVTVEFPAGILKDLDAAAILEPYALRRLLPDFGPNALAAAAGIVAGQGGRVALERAARGRLQWSIDLPLASPAAEATKVEPGATGAGRRSAASAADPFA